MEVASIESREEGDGRRERRDGNGMTAALRGRADST
jgi:hypothetical protein